VAEVLTQIEAKQYDLGIKKDRIENIVKLGLGFKGKECAVEYLK
jgi:hypothetical protein